MNEVLRLLEVKNYWFNKFLSLCDKFIVELKSHPDKVIDELDLFEKNRQSLLNIIKRTEEKVQFLLSTETLRVYVPSSAEKTKINFLLREKDSVLNQIIKLDSEIIALMEKMKKEDEEKMKALEKGKKLISKYKSNSPVKKQVDQQV
jgi:hypothetical protein